MEEIWKDIKGYEGYQVSNLGRVRTHNKTTYTKFHGIRNWEDKILHFKPSTTSNKKSKQGMGYRVDLWKNGKPKTFLVARLVATTFLEDLINTNMTVNHKDGNRLNNNVNNLEWISRAENIKYGFENEQYKKCCKKCSLIKNDIKYDFYSYSQAERFLSKYRGYIYNILKNNKNIVKNNNNEEFLIIPF